MYPQFHNIHTQKQPNSDVENVKNLKIFLQNKLNIFVIIKHMRVNGSN